jgi:hypothetical protein
MKYYRNRYIKKSTVYGKKEKKLLVYFELLFLWILEETWGKVKWNVTNRN